MGLNERAVQGSITNGAGRALTEQQSSHQQTSPSGRPRSELAPSFDQLVDAYYAQSTAADEQAKTRAEELFLKIERSFEQQHGQISHRCFSSVDQAAVIVTESCELHTVPTFRKPPAVELFFLAQRLHSEARRCTALKDAQGCQDLVYFVLATLLRTMDRNPDEPTADTVKLMKRELSQAEETYVAAAKRRAQLFYSSGVVAGTFGIFIISLLSLFAMPRLISHALGAGGDPQNISELFTACLNAGGAGALLSVMMRMSSGTLAIRYEVGPLLLFLVGGFRPIIGGVSGVAVYTLYQAHLLPLQVPSNAKEFFVSGGLAFLAGFSERLAQDAFVRTGAKALGGSQKDTPQRSSDH